MTSKIQSGESNGLFTLFAMVGDTNYGKFFSAMVSIKLPGKKTILEMKDGLISKSDGKSKAAETPGTATSPQLLKADG